MFLKEERGVNGKAVENCIMFTPTAPLFSVMVHELLHAIRPEATEPEVQRTTSRLCRMFSMDEFVDLLYLVATVMKDTHKKKRHLDYFRVTNEKKIRFVYGDLDFV